MKAKTQHTYTSLSWIKTLGTYMPRQQIKGKVRECVWALVLPACSAALRNRAGESRALGTEAQG